MPSTTPAKIDSPASATADTAARVTDLLRESADLIAAAGELVRADDVLTGLARLTCAHLAEARQALTPQAGSAAQQPLINAGITLEAFRRLVAVAGHDQARALASLAGTYLLDAAQAVSDAEVAS